MNQKGQIETIIIFIILIGLVLISRFGERWGLFKKPEIKKEEAVSEQVWKKTISSPFPSQKTPSPPQKELEEEKIIDTTPPKRFNQKPTGDLPAETRKTIISLETDEKAICRYSRVSGLSYDSMSDFFAKTNATSHQTEISFLTEGEKYSFYVKCADQFENKNLDDFEISFSVKKPEDKTPPERRFLSPSGTLPAETSQVELTVGTDEKANCYYSTLPGKSFWEKSSSFSPNETNTYHTAKIYNLTSGNIYDYFVRCCDFFGNCNDGDALIRFGIGVSP